MGLLLGLLLALALAVAGCGGGDKGGGVASLAGASATSTTTAGGVQQELAFARCMRQHGANLPDPRVRGDGIVLELPDRAERESPKFKAAQQACRQVPPNGGQPSPPSAQEVQQALAFARCMRQHGINLPDPQVTGGRYRPAVPEGAGPNPTKFRAAEQACGQQGGGVPSERVGDAARRGAAHAPRRHATTASASSGYGAVTAVVPGV